MKEWWGTLTIPEGEAISLQIGPMALWLRRQDGDLLVGAAQGSDAMDETLQLASSSTEETLPAGMTLYRFAGARGAVRLTPRFADRAIIARPEQPFWLPPGADVTVYISAPLWGVVSLGGVDVVELPLFRPSDTWFGPSTIAGELCYAVQTALGRRLDTIPLRAHRAITAIQIRNRATDSLAVQRIRLPAGLLGVYADDARGLRTPGVILERNGPTEAVVRLESQSDRVRLLAPPRQADEPSLLRAITSFLP